MNSPLTLGNVALKPLAFPIPANVYAETVVSVKHYTDRLFSFRITRPQSLRFRSGEFVMIGLPVEQPDGSTRPLLRAYSIASANWEEQLEFFSIKVPDGPLTSRLQHIRPGDTVLVGRKPTGTLLRVATCSMRWVGTAYGWSNNPSAVVLSGKSMGPDSQGSARSR